MDKDQVDEQPEVEQEPEIQQPEVMPEVMPEVEQQQPEQHQQPEVEQQQPEEQAENIDQDILQQAMVIADIDYGQAEPVQDQNTFVGEDGLGLQEEDQQQQEEDKQQQEAAVALQVCHENMYMSLYYWLF